MRVVVIQTVSNYLRLTKAQFKIVDTLCFLSKNLYNVGVYNERQYYKSVRENLTEMWAYRPDITRDHCVLTKTYNPYTRKKNDPFKEISNYHFSKGNENYKLLNVAPAQQTLKSVEEAYRSYFGLLKLKAEGKWDLPVGPPGYLEKNGRYKVAYPRRDVSIKKNMVTLGLSREFKKYHRLTGKELRFKIPNSIKPHQIREVTLLPINDGKCYKIEFSYDAPQKQVDLTPAKFLAIDLGIDNFATFLDNATGTAVILDGKYLKSINWWYNKENARLQSIKDRQHAVDGITKRQLTLLCKRNNRINEVFNQYVNVIIRHCILKKIGNVILPTWDGIKQNINHGKIQNQKFVSIPYAKFRQKLAGKCALFGIKYHDQFDESYTSQVDALNLDEIKKQPYGRCYRIERGLYKSATGTLVNADVNGCLNHWRKVVGDSFVREIVEYGRFTRPTRIRPSFGQTSRVSVLFAGAPASPQYNPPVLTGGP